LEVWLIGDGQAGHRYAISETGGGAGRLERLEGNGSEKYLVQIKSLLGGSRDGQVAVVGRVKAPSKEGYTHGDMVAGAGGFCSVAAASQENSACLSAPMKSDGLACKACGDFCAKT